LIKLLQTNKGAIFLPHSVHFCLHSGATAQCELF